MPDALRAGDRRRAGRGSWSSRTTTSRGSRSTSCARCARCTGTSRCSSFDSRRYVGAQIGIHNPTGGASGQGVARAQPRVRGDRRRPGRGRAARRRDRRRCAVPSALTFESQGRRLRPLRGRAHHAVVPRGRRLLDRRVRDLLRADGRVAVPRHRAAGRAPRAHARRSSGGWPAETLTVEHYVDDNMRNIPDHYHAHARPKGGFFGHGFRRP